MKAVSDDILIRRSKSGKQMAFGLLVERYSSYCYSIVYRIVSNRAEAEDVVQETFVLAWQKLESYDCNKGKFTTWLYTIATRLAIDTHRKRQQHEELKPEDDFGNSSDNALNTICNNELEQQLRYAMQSLTELQKAVFVLREIEEIEVKEVGIITGLSSKQIKDNLYVARKKVKEQLQKVILI
jgi:RNA polymerase sigma-70 factor (ECF subfamily)